MERNYSKHMMMEPARKRPTGVTIIAVLLAIGGIFALLGALLGFFGIGLLGVKIAGISGGIVTGIGVLLGAIALLIALIPLILSWGLWTLQTWAFWTTVIVESLSIVYTVLSWLQDRTTVPSLIGSLIIPVIILAYFLFDRNVRAAFRT
ncbi:MAG: DUF2127 domain-containing protein [Chloroflexi bacterium]|nr:MAG: DUF2127 domain-containing protein [Chloroflexota bacterium]